MQRRVRRELGQSKDLALDLDQVGSPPGEGELRRIERRQGGHGEQTALPTRFLGGRELSGLKHRQPTRRVDRQQSNPEPRRAPHGTGDGVRNVVELEIEEDVRADLV